MMSPPYDRIHYIAESESRKVILDWFSDDHVGLEEKEAFIDALINFRDRCDSFFRYQTYFLAAEAIAVFPDCSKADEIVDQLLKWSYAFCRTSRSDWKVYPRALTIAARERLERTDIKRVVNRLAEVVHTTDSLVVLRRAATELGKLNPGDASAIAALEQLVQRSQSLESRFEAVESLVEIAPSNSLIIPTLIEIIYSAAKSFEQNARIIRDVIWKFREVAIGNKAVVDAIIELLEICNEHIALQSQDQREFSWHLFLRGESATTLGIIGIDSPIAVSALLHLVHQSKMYVAFYPPDGWEAVEALSKIAVGNSTAIADLSQALLEAQEPLLRCHIAAALLRIEPNNLRATIALSEILETAQIEMQMLESDTELTKYLLWRAADSLGRNDPNCQSAVDALFQLVQFSASDLPIFSSLIAIDSTHQLALRALVQLLETEPDSFLFEVLAFFLEVEEEKDLAINALTKLIQISQSRSNRYAAAKILRKIDLGNSLAIATFIELQKTDDSLSWGWDIARDLGEVDINNEQVIEALIDFVGTFQRTGNNHNEQELTNCFKHLKTIDLLTKVVRELKNCLDPKRTELNDDEFEGGAYLEWEDVEGIRAEVAYQIIWYCAENLSYPDFYQAYRTSLA